ncbi:hypothetical protein HBI81_182880 [Parastagonospora nodorum]|nr:hypothetical protein HBI10_142790 [Parastagonospora nodorum]KAH4021074.1 hypothetical protein HBI13_111090 [Parastagonospora nodorum]KAH4220252.1 hypothetical protein HBI06_171520 [Parastagonospora nodorum]KAH4232646.1 hypothetical protein HBI05_168490 [Parastagonospora nodorum]KAH4902742.1 hypothetical protein HBI80_127220 [Parastagonospora nodorum]
MCASSTIPQHNLRPLSLTVNPFVAAAAQKLLSERMEDLKSQDFACRSASSDPFNRLCTGRPGPSLGACPLIQASSEGDVLLIGRQNASSVTLSPRSNSPWTA